MFPKQIFRKGIHIFGLGSYSKVLFCPYLTLFDAKTPYLALVDDIFHGSNPQAVFEPFPRWCER